MNVQIWVLALLCKTALCAAEALYPSQTQYEETQVIPSANVPIPAVEVQTATEAKTEDDQLAPSTKQFPVAPEVQVKNKACTRSKLRCNSGHECYDYSQKCDGYVDCTDFSDELGCGHCSTRLIACGASPNFCYNPYISICNRILDCPNGEDEQGCSPECHPSQIQCFSGSGCYSVEERCNNVAQCHDASDEKNCTVKQVPQTQNRIEQLPFKEGPHASEKIEQLPFKEGPHASEKIEQWPSIKGDPHASDKIEQLPSIKEDPYASDKIKELPNLGANSSEADHGDVDVESYCELTPITNARVEPERSANFLYSRGDTVDINCLPGFHSDNLRTFELVCMDSGQWDSEIPTCVAVTCDLPPDLDNGRVSVNGKVTGNALEFGTQITYNCDPGYVIEGPRDRWCEAKGWSDEEPVCEEITCKDVPEVSNGQPVGTSGVFFPGNEVEIRCDFGFRPATRNKAYLACTTQGYWDTTHAQCTAVNCQTPTSPKNGWFKQEGYERYQTKGKYEFTDKVTFGCEPGFALHGKKTIRCRENGWSDPFPTCTEVLCPRPPVPVNGWIVGEDNKQKFLPGETVTYECEAWYNLRGSAQRTCMEKGWSGTPVECQLRGCPPPPKITGVEFFFKRTIQKLERFALEYIPFAGSLVVKCPAGQKPNGNQQAFCERSGNWNIPKCIEVFCRKPYYVPNGYVEGIMPEREKYYYNHKITHRCNFGYRLVGTAERYCSEYGWTDKLPRCEEIRCLKPYVENGMVVQLKASWPLKIGGTAEIQCNQGFKMLENRATIECKEDGTWNDTLNKCTEITCPRPSIPNGYAVSRKGHWPLMFGQAADIYCQEGFRLRDGISTFFCNWDEQQNDFSKICTDEKFCTGPVYVRNGRIQQHIFTAFKENPDYRSGKTLPVGFRMAYECNPGYRMIGQPDIVCSEQGWFGPLPSCEEIVCPQPKTQNGYVELLQGYSSLLVNGTVRIRCNHKFVLSDDRSIIQCNQNGQWNDTLDKCADIRSCVRPAVVQNGQIMEDAFYDGRLRSRYPINFRLTYQCSPGYQMIGESVTVCTESGWSSDLPICKEILCSPPRNPEHGMLLDSEPFRLDSTATFKCYYGFQLYPTDAALTCTESGWVGQHPMCTETHCPTLGEIPNGLFHSLDRPVHTRGIYVWPLGSRVQYSCQEPYMMNGEPELQCMRSGQWSSDPPICEGAYCTKPNVEHSMPSSSHFRYQPGDKFLIQCLPGYQLKETNELVCMEDGKWTSTSGCQEILCGPPPPLMFGVVYPKKAYYHFGDTVKYSCRVANITLKGTRERTCTDEGWSSNTPVCVVKNEKPCSSPLLLGLEDNLRLNQTADRPYKIGDSVIVDCRPGFQPMGNPLENLIVCTPHGNWSTDMVTCTESKNDEVCPPPPPIANGRLMSVKEDYRIGDTVTIVCDRGFRPINGTDVGSCLPGGKWEEDFAQCVEVWCAPPQLPTNGMLENSDLLLNGTWPFHSEVIFVCNSGFQLHGHHWIKCLQNGWSANPPTCKEITCPDPGTPEEGWKNVESLTIGSRVQFECFSGYQLIGPKERICLKNGQWSDEQPYCHNGKSSCPGLPVPTGGLKSGTYYNENGEVNFACTSGYMFVGSPSRVCKNGTWTGSEALCVGKNEFNIPETISYQLQSSLTELSSTRDQFPLPSMHLKNSKVSQPLMVRPQHVVVYFILDATTSIGRKNFEFEKEFAKAMINKLNISKCGMRVGVITLSSQAVAEFYPNDFHSKHNILDAVDKIVYKEGSASLQSALEILNDLMKETQSALPGGVAKSHVFLLTDGKLNSGLNPVGAAKRLKENFKMSFTCLALTGQWRKQILYSIATDKEHVFFLDSFTTLRWLSDQITKGTNDYSKCGRGLNPQTQPLYLERLGLRKKNITFPWPWTVFISLRGNPICRGSLINNEWILTSAWCVTSTNGILSPEDISLHIGLISGSLLAEGVYRHPDYNVGLIQLKEPIVLSEAIRPICLPLPLHNKTLYLPGEYGYVSTWGERNSEGKYPLKHVSFPIQTTSACRSAQDGQVSEQTFCAGNGHVHLSAENGDYGGPMMQYQLDSDGQPMWVQIGIASLPEHHIYNYFTDVSKVLNWIRAFVPL